MGWYKDFLSNLLETLPMENQEEIMYSFKAGLSIIEGTLSEKSIPFNIVGVYNTKDQGPFARIKIGDEEFFSAPTTNGSKIWIADFPVKNTKGTKIPPGYIGFPTEVAGVIVDYQESKPKGAFQKIDSLGSLGNIGLNEIVREEVQKAFDDYDYASEERESQDREYYEQDMEAEISTASSFMQDIQGSINKIKVQKELKTTNQEVDNHLIQAEKHLKEAMNSYLDGLDSDVKADVIDRLGEVNIKEV